MSNNTAFWGSRKVQEGKAKAHLLKTKPNPTPVIRVGKWDRHKMEEWQGRKEKRQMEKLVQSVIL